MTDTDREAFEAWVSKQGHATGYGGDGTYEIWVVSRWWEAYQAATQQSAARIAALEAEVAALRKDAERWRTFLATRPANTHAVIIQAIDDAAVRKGGGV